MKVIGRDNMADIDDECREEIHKVVGNVIRVADQLGVLLNDIELEGRNLWEIMNEIENFIKKSLEDE